jgi:hypothetical protein
MKIGCNMSRITVHIVTILFGVSEKCPDKGELATFEELEGKMLGRLVLMAFCILVSFVTTLFRRGSLHRLGD